MGIKRKQKTNKINTREDLAQFFNVKPIYLKLVLYSSSRDQFYKEIIINKSTGKPRTLHAVSGKLRDLQQKALYALQANEAYKPTIYAHGFVPERSIITNAKQHVKKKLIIKVDLKDFFPSINFGRVKGMFMSSPFYFGEEAATTMAQLACLDEPLSVLPQGGVLSPYIANMLCRRMDKRMGVLAKEYKCNFTRYADDITFSTNNINNIDVDELLNKIYEIIEDENFIVNDEKTKVLTKKDRQVVAGIVVNDGLNVNRKYIRNLRAVIRNCEKYGLENQIVKKRGFKSNSRENRLKITKYGRDKYFFYGRKVTEVEACKIFLQHIIGKLNFFGDVIFANLKKDKEGKLIVGYNDIRNRYPRFSTHAKLVTSLYQVLLKKPLYKEFSDQLCRMAKKNPLCIHFDLIEKRNQFIKDWLFDYRRNNNDKGFPSPDVEKTTEVLQSLKDSTGGLGIFTHSGEFKFESGMNILMEKYYPYKYYLPKSLLYTFDTFINKYEQECMNLEHNATLDPTEPPLKKAAKKLKQETRFDPSETSLLETFKLSITEAKRNLLYERKGISFDLVGLDDLQFYTHTPSVQKALGNICHSMLKNTKGTKISVQAAIFETEGILELRIFDDVEPEPVVFEPHGKINQVMKQLKGLCEYWIESVGSKGNRVCFDVFSKEVMENTSFIGKGFAHRLRFFLSIPKISKKNSEQKSKNQEKSDFIFNNVLYLDNRQNNRPYILKNLKKLKFIKDIDSKENIKKEEFCEKTYDLAIVHQNNEEADYIKEWQTLENSIKWIFFSGSFDKEYNEQASDCFRMSEKTFKSFVKLKKYLKKIYNKEKTE